MEIITLRRAGGSLTLTIPSAFVRALGLAEGERMGVTVDDGKLVVEPTVQRKPKYTLEELLAQCDPSGEFPEDEAEWMAGGPVGREAI